MLSDVVTLTLEIRKLSEVRLLTDTVPASQSLLCVARFLMRPESTGSLASSEKMPIEAKGWRNLNFKAATVESFTMY